MPALRILHLEDNPLDAELMVGMLTQAGIQCDIVRVDTHSAFVEGLRDRRLELIISDFSLPGFDGRVALTIAQQERPDIPFIFVSGTIGEEVAIESLLAGATDYVLKHRFGRLIPAVQRALREANDRRERQTSANALRASEERYRHLFASNPHPMWVHAIDSLQILAVNEAAIHHYGYSAFEFLAMRINDIDRGIDPENRQHAKKDGTVIDVELASHDISFDGQAARLLSAIDVTEKKRVQEQLLRTQRMDTIGTLASGIAHDLNNVLAPILMAVQLLKDKHPDEGSQRLLETLQASAKRGAGIVRQVLTFARGVEGERVPLQPRHLVSNIDKMIQQTFPKSIRLESRLAKDLWTILGDPTQLDQVLLNLCVNARDAMPQGGALTLAAENTMLDENYSRMHHDAAPGPYVMIEVADSGHGMPAHVIDRIFEPFFTTKEVGKGTGLGLSTAMAIVKSHHGFVNVYSELGRGTSFRIFLPASQSVKAQESQASLSGLPSGEGELILVVDDEAPVRDITQVTLESYGYRVVTAKNGAEAMACYARQSDEIKVVVLDMMMPIMDGPSTIHALRTINPDVIVIAASGLLEIAKSAGATPAVGPTVRAVLTKPYTAERLLTTLREVLAPQAE